MKHKISFHPTFQFHLFDWPRKVRAGQPDQFWWFYFCPLYLELDLAWYTGHHRLTFNILGFWIDLCLVVQTIHSEEVLTPILEARDEILSGEATVVPHVFRDESSEPYVRKWEVHFFTDWIDFLSFWKGWNWSNIMLLNFTLSGTDGLDLALLGFHFQIVKE